MFEWENDFPPHILERGWRYARSGAVQHIIRKKDEIEAVVEGSETYKVKMSYDGHFILDAYCSCPYAAGGNYCKHMAAVLYEIDCDEKDDREYSETDFEEAVSTDDKLVPIDELISKADRSLLEQILMNLASGDEQTETRIRVMLAGVSTSADIEKLKREIDNIFYAYSNRGGYIDYRNAMGFCEDLTSYLDGKANSLFDEARYYEAFQLTIYAYIELGNCDIDDDGEIAMISDVCYKIWQRAVSDASEVEKNLIKKWFREHSDDGTVVDYMEDTLQDFLRYELASKEELKEMEDLDRLIEESVDSNKCQLLVGFFNEEAQMDDGPTTLYAAYSVKGGKIQTLFHGWSRSVYYLAQDGSIIHTGSGGAANYVIVHYELAEDEKGGLSLKEKEALVSDGFENPEKPFTWYPDGRELVGYDENDVPEYSAEKEVQMDEETGREYYQRIFDRAGRVDLRQIKG